jgi:hypothetical protein
LLWWEEKSHLSSINRDFSRLYDKGGCFEITLALECVSLGRIKDMGRIKDSTA